ncbi:MAG TPA: hypothetical protein VJR30_01875, partial [Bradyrhizobium sp.]|nr:hypothetical protein [Bradyrhizobium sp.]
AASMIACRRSAARSARLSLLSGNSPDTTLGSLARAALLVTRRRVDMGRLLVLLRALVMTFI